MTLIHHYYKLLSLNYYFEINLEHHKLKHVRKIQNSN